MSYAELTFKDKNPIKRWLQRQRLVSAVRLGAGDARVRPSSLCDFGAGNGELCLLLAERHPGARLACYEPTPALLAEARQNLVGLASVEFHGDLSALAPASFDAVYCLEVFEHLPPRETADALAAIRALLKPGGTLVVGVPVEIGIPALYKGIFRMVRRYGAFDANLRNVAASFVGRPPEVRPVDEIAPGFHFHQPHVGFDHRRLKREIAAAFDLRRVAASPFAWFGSALMPEVYFVAEKGGATD